MSTFYSPYARRLTICYKRFWHRQTSSVRQTSIAVRCMTGLIPLGTRNRFPFMGGANGKSAPSSYKKKKNEKRHLSNEKHLRLNGLSQAEEAKCHLVKKTEELEKSSLRVENQQVYKLSSYMATNRALGDKELRISL